MYCGHFVAVTEVPGGQDGRLQPGLRRHRRVPRRQPRLPGPPSRVLPQLRPGLRRRRRPGESAIL